MIKNERESVSVTSYELNPEFKVYHADKNIVFTGGMDS
jgi:hypothetical protein